MRKDALCVLFVFVKLQNFICRLGFPKGRGKGAILQNFVASLCHELGVEKVAKLCYHQENPK